MASVMLSTQAYMVVNISGLSILVQWLRKTRWHRKIKVPGNFSGKNWPNEQTHGHKSSNIQHGRQSCTSALGSDIYNYNLYSPFQKWTIVIKAYIIVLLLSML